MRLLIVEDEADLAEPLAEGLRREGYAVDIAADGECGLDLLEVESYDLAILDLNLPGINGLELLRHARAHWPGLPILILTARGEPRDRVAGLNLGADDYVLKPFHFGELVARTRALLRRELRTRDPVLRCQDLRLDPASREAWQAERPLQLTKKEFAVLEYLLSRPGEVVSQEELISHIWDAQVNPVTNVLPVHVGSLRRSLGDDPRNPRYIRTVVGQGYQLISEDSGLC